MKLCVFYNKPSPYGLAYVEWFVCQACQKKLSKSLRLDLLKKASKELAKEW